MSILRPIFWFSVFLASTFAFTVLFEHGPSNFVANAQKELDGLSKYYGGAGDIKKKKDESDHLIR